MKTMKSILALVLACMLLMSSLVLAEEPAFYQLGDKIDDFTVTTFDGKTVTLSEVLKEKEAVLINIWATWCGPCRNEFPFMEEAYKQYSDKVEVIALSCEPTDTNDVLASFVAEMGMTFNVSQDTVGMAEKFNVSAIPTSVMIDRFGTICFIESGSLPDVSSFTRLFDAFLGEEYTESVLLESIPPMKPTVAASAEADVAAALGAANAANPTDVYTWPMVVTEKDGRSVVASSNTGCNDTIAAVDATVTAKAGDAIVVTFKTSTEASFDLLNIAVNGKHVKVFGGEHDWMTYAMPVTADGDYTVTLSYVKDTMAEEGEDAVWVDEVAVATGDAAAAALAANPVYPTADATVMTAVTPTAKEIVFADEFGVMMGAFGPKATYYIINDDTVTFQAQVAADVDPEGAFFYCYYDGQSVSLPAALNGANYVVTTGVDALETTGYPYAYVELYLDPAGNNTEIAVYFRNEENVNGLISQNKLDEKGVSWTYADGTLPGSAAQPEKAVDFITEANYVVKYVDQDGNPVAGVMCQVCDESTCQVFVSDENGVCAFTLAPYAWEIHTLMVPAGYTGDTKTVTTAPVEGGEMVFTLTKQ